METKLKKIKDWKDADSGELLHLPEQESADRRGRRRFQRIRSVTFLNSLRFLEIPPGLRFCMTSFRARKMSRKSAKIWK